MTCVDTPFAPPRRAGERTVRCLVACLPVFALACDARTEHERGLAALAASGVSPEVFRRDDPDDPDDLDDLDDPRGRPVAVEGGSRGAEPGDLLWQRTSSTRDGVTVTERSGGRWRLRFDAGAVGPGLELPVRIDLTAFDLELALRVVQVEFNGLIELLLVPPETTLPVENPAVRVTFMRRESEARSIYDLTLAVGAARRSVHRQPGSRGFLVGERYRLRLRGKGDRIECRAIPASEAASDHHIDFSLPLPSDFAVGVRSYRLLLTSREGRAGIEVEAGPVRLRSAD